MARIINKEIEIVSSNLNSDKKMIENVKEIVNRIKDWSFRSICNC